MHCPEHLYIHFPFCKNKCHFCDFVAFEKHEEFIELYHNSLCEEIRRFSSKISLDKKRTIKTIFFGGGTPSLYPLHLLKELFSLLRNCFDLSQTKEISLEVNPGGITIDHFSTWRALGINRLSVGVQILDDEVLARLNRFQKIEDVEFLFLHAPDYFSQLSSDFILGLPSVSLECWEKSIKRAVEWNISHISIYMLTVHEKTPLFFKIKKGEVNVPCDSHITSLYKKTVAFLENNNFEHYELSNFAKLGKYSIHNQAYWDRKPYQGFGLGAASFDGKIRTTNIKNLKKYTDFYAPSSSEEAMLFASTESLSEKQERLEELMLSLRQKKGMSLHRMVYSLNSDEQKSLYEQISLLKSHNLIDESEGYIRLTTHGMALENEIITSLL